MFFDGDHAHCVRGCFCRKVCPIWGTKIDSPAPPSLLKQDTVQSFPEQDGVGTIVAQMLPEHRGYHAHSQRNQVLRRKAIFLFSISLPSAHRYVENLQYGPEKFACSQGFPLPSRQTVKRAPLHNAG